MKSTRDGCLQCSTFQMATEWLWQWSKPCLKMFLQTQILLCETTQGLQAHRRAWCSMSLGGLKLFTLPMECQIHSFLGIVCKTADPVWRPSGIKTLNHSSRRCQLKGSKLIETETFFSIKCCVLNLCLPIYSPWFFHARGTLSCHARQHEGRDRVNNLERTLRFSLASRKNAEMYFTLCWII